MSFESAIASRLGGGDGLLSFAVAYAGGVLAGFGPCVLPMMPAVFGYVTGSVAGSSAGDSGLRVRGRYVGGLGLAAVFVLGMSMVFATMGVAAGLLGRALFVGAWASYALAAICGLLGLHLLGVFELPFAALARVRPRMTKRVGVLGALLLGMSFGVVSSPCSTPVLAAIATLAAARQSALVGGALLFVFGLGKGLPLMLIGLASGSLGAMGVVSRFTPALLKVSGAALLGAAMYLIWIG